MGELGRRSFSYLRLIFAHRALSRWTRSPPPVGPHNFPPLFYGPLQASWLANDALLSAKPFSSQFICVKLALMQIVERGESTGFISKPGKYFGNIWFISDGSDLRGSVSLLWCSSHLLFGAASTGHFIIHFHKWSEFCPMEPSSSFVPQWTMENVGLAAVSRLSGSRAC